MQVLYAADERAKELEHYHKVLQNRLADLEATHEEEKAKIMERHTKEMREYAGGCASVACPHAWSDVCSQQCS
jgi:hypothetical protein